MPEQYKPSTSGKVSAGIAAGIVGAGTYAAYKHSATPKAAQNSVKVPSSGSGAARGAATSAASSALSKTPMPYNKWQHHNKWLRQPSPADIKNLENSYRLKMPQTPLQKAVGGAVAFGKAVVGAGIILGVWEGLFTRPANFGEDAALAKARQKQLALTNPSESKEVQATTYPFTGGQMDGVKYRLRGQVEFRSSKGSVSYYDFDCTCFGPIGSIEAYMYPRYTNKHYRTVKVYCRGGSAGFDKVDTGLPLNYPSPQQPNYYYNIIGESLELDLTVRIVNLTVVRPDGLPDTGGNPPPTTASTYSTGAAILMALDAAYPAVGEVESPPPALISQPGDFLYDGARAPLQRVLDGTKAPWQTSDELESQPGDFLYDGARAPLQRVLDGSNPPWKENPVARMPGFSSVPAAPAPTQDVPQPEVADSTPSTDAEQSRRYWDAQGPDLTPSTGVTPGTLTPVAPTPASVTPSTGVKPETTTTTTPETTKKTTQFNYNTPDRSPQPDTKTTPETATSDSTTKADPKGDFDGWWTSVGLVGIGALLSPKYNPQLFTDIETTTQKATCQSLNGGCSTGININQQISNAANNSAATNTILQAADLAAIGVINEKLGPQIPNGGIGAKLRRFVDWSVGDRVIGMMSMVASVHNAMMLSNNVGQTLFSIFDNLGNTGKLIVNPEGDSNIDSKQWVTSNLDSLFNTMLGAELWTSVKTSYKAANNIFSTSSNMYNNLRSIHNDSQELLNMVRRDTAELGNALVEEGLISEDNWDIRDPKLKIKSKMLNRLDSMNRGLEDLDNKLEAIEQLTSTLLNIAESAKEIRENSDKLGKELTDANKAFKTTRDAAIEALPDFDFDFDDLF